MRKLSMKTKSDLWYWASLVAQLVKNLPALQETQAQFLSQEDPLEKEMANHSRILAWKIPWTEEPGGPQSMGSWVGHDWATKPPLLVVHRGWPDKRATEELWRSPDQTMIEFHVCLNISDT